MDSGGTIILNPKLVALERALFWASLWIGTGLILWASKDYFIGVNPHGFLIERPHLTMQSWWKVSVYIHVLSGCLCIVSSLLQYSKVLLKKAPKVHKSLGYIYVLSLLIAVTPTGMVLSAVAKGGWISQLGFFVMNFSTLICVVQGMKAIFKRKVAEHEAWITRSFALVTSAITFRTLQISLLQLQVPYEVIYPICVWLGMILNLWVAEYYLYKTKIKTKQN